MKKIILLIVVLIANLARADCFMAQEKDKVLTCEGECKKAYAPESTFKIALTRIFHEFMISSLSSRVSDL